MFTGMFGLTSMLHAIEVVILDPLKLVLVGTALELGAFLFEVPTGALADSKSRRLSVIVGFFVTGLAFIVYGLEPDFWFLIVGSFVWGIGWTFISGAHQAWLADEIGVLEAAPVYLTSQKFSAYASIIGILLAVPIAVSDLSYPILVAGLGMMFWAVAANLGMQELNFKPASETLTYKTVIVTFQEGLGVVRQSKVLILLIIVALIVGAFSEGFDRLNSAHLLRNFEFPRPFGFDPVVTFAVMIIGGNLISIALVNLLQPKLDLDNTQATLTLLAATTFTICCSVILFANTSWVWLAIALVVIVAPLRRISEPLEAGWINQHTHSEVRATVFSFHSQSDALGQIGGGPAVGYTARLFSIPVAITLSALLLIPAKVLYYIYGKPDNK
jgi:DHA3 family tetracycline resistance protein-like MFS transporter